MLEELTEARMKTALRMNCTKIQFMENQWSSEDQLELHSYGDHLGRVPLGSVEHGEQLRIAWRRNMADEGERSGPRSIL
ncbi:hypothetical protein KIN20_017419 [Parelaphostrongylus tenuis]|uniref:Uncharacterized protein n=1 Tax=Parelaphostrongylus tenuis TaxID=148309 RepID=A0AAD5QRH6_PARTN|nr:hypothetical protein KIN20_017419 [Parelaphostrongylus tenuis]